MTELGEQCRHVDRPRRKQRAHRDPSFDQAPEVVDLLPRALHLREHTPRPGGHGLTGLGGNDRPARPGEELGAQLGLEPPDLVRQGRLRDVELLGRTGEVAVPLDGLDVPQLAQFHGCDCAEL